MMPSARFPDLEGASVLITGGGSGIGAALTEGFTRQGARVAFIDIAEAPSRALVERIAASEALRPLYIKADLRDIEALRKAAAEAAAAHGPVTVLINNAAFDTAQAVAPGMKQAGKGSIINFTSTSFLINHPDMPSYTAAKAGIIGLTKGLAGRLGPDKIRVNAVAPGWVITERQRDLWVTEERLAAHVAKQCIREVMTPDDMVGTCLFLASDASRMLTAQTLIVDGGYL
jgi:NAD(P)-dependent dehydrogenase (short-subunit alcohol dehydrogenase family)